MRDHPAVVDLASRILVPAAQVQDRRHRRARRTAPRCKVHDIGLYLHRNDAGELGFEVLVGGGLGRTPYHRPDDPRVPAARASALLSRGDPARLQPATAGATTSTRRGSRSWCTSLGIEKYRARRSRRNGRPSDRGALDLPDDAIARASARLSRRPLRDRRRRRRAALAARDRRRSGFRPLGRSTTSRRTRSPGYAIVDVSLKPPGETPGDCSGRADGARSPTSPTRYSFGEVRVTLRAEPGAAACPPRRLCRRSGRRSTRPGSARPTSAWSATSSPARGWITAASPTRARSRSPSASPSASPTGASRRRSASCSIKISGCINACGHHHVGHIGILGVDKNGEEFYQITLGGSADENAALGAILGPAVPERRVDRRGRHAGRGLSALRAGRRALPRHLPPRRAWRRSRRRSMPLIKDGRFVADRLARISPTTSHAAGAAPSSCRCARWQTRARRRSRRAPARSACACPTPVAPQRSPAMSSASTLIALDFPKFTDGRAYSQARLLRERLGYQGRAARRRATCCATSLLFMQRCGFDGFVVGERAIEENWPAAFGEFDVFYQARPTAGPG